MSENKDAVAGWLAVGLYGSASGAAKAVAEGSTGDIKWDATPRKYPQAHYALSYWEPVEDPTLGKPS